MSRTLRIFVAENCSNRNVLVPKGTSFTRAEVLLLILPPLTVGGTSRHFLKWHVLKWLVPCYYVAVSCRKQHLMYDELHVGICFATDTATTDSGRYFETLS